MVLKDYLYDFNDYFAILKSLNLSLGFITPKWLGTILGYQLYEDKQLWSLRGSVYKLLDQRLALKLFNKFFELEPLDHTQ
jgi:hypothetical protein